MPYFCGCAKVEIRERVCGRFHAGSALCAAGVIQGSLARCSGERCPYLKAYRNPRILRSIITPKLEGVHVQLFNKEFRAANLSALLFQIERSGCTLRKITLRDCIPMVNKSISILRASPALEELTLAFRGWNDGVNSCLLETLPSLHTKGWEEGGMLAPRLMKLGFIIQHKPKSESLTVPSMSFLEDALIEAVENRWNHQVAGVAKLTSVQVWVAVPVELYMVVSPGAGNVERWNRLQEGGMELLFHVIGGKADDECAPASSRMIRVNPDPKSPMYLYRQYV
ncbi:hypothetical protein F5146DRAFT_995605 [Armillaria mellea]|nr:hypothetical protein F5146DRAFT_995605 [Armillaria mellea]